MTILEAVGAYLASNGHGTLGTSLFLALMPDTPDTMRCVYESPGYAPEMTLGNAATAIDKPGLQVTCRAPGYAAARDDAQAIRALLGAVANTALSGVNVLRIAPVGSVTPIGEDEKGRHLVTVNFDVWVLP